MPDWLKDLAPAEGEVTPDALAVRLALSFVLGFVVAGVCALAQRKPRTEFIPLLTTLVLLTVLIAMVTLVINDKVARAFSLVGALAIVRFRTVVEDTRDTAFVIFAVVVGMAVGSGYSHIAIAGIPVVAAAALLMKLLGGAAEPAPCNFSLTVRLGIGRDPDELFRDIFAKRLAACHLRSTATARQGAAFDLSYLVRLRDEADAAALVAELNGVEGVQEVELRRL